MEKRNLRKYYLRYVLYYFAYVLITGGIIQSFMLESGISGQQVSIYTAVIQIVQAATMLLCSPLVERSRNLIRMNVVSQVGLIPTMVAMFLIALYVQMPVPLKYGLMLGSGVIAYVTFGVMGILEYKLPYRIFDIRNYGEVVSVAGVFSGAASLATSTLFSWCISRYDFFRVVMVFMVVGLVMLILSMVVGLSYEDIEGQPGISQFENRNTEQTGEDVSGGNRPSRSIFAYLPFKQLLIPNFIRGFSSGTFAILTTIGYYYSILNAESASWLVIITNVLTMVTCFVYAKISRKNKDPELILLSSLIMLLSMGCILLGKNTAVFLMFFAVGMIFKTFIDFACPVVVTKIVDYEMIGRFSSWRMALYMAGAALAGVALVPMLETLGGEVTMLINGAGFVVTGVGYYLAGKKDMKKAEK